MFIALALVFPALLLLGVLGMERVERPLEQSRVRSDLERFLAADDDAAQPETIEQVVADGYGRALSRYWRRRRTVADVPAGPRESDAASAVVAPHALGHTERGTNVAGA